MVGWSRQKVLYEASDGEVLGGCSKDIEGEKEEVLSQDWGIVESRSW